MWTDPEYNRQVRPNEGGITDEVEIGVFTNSIRTVSEIDMTMVLDVFLQVVKMTKTSLQFLFNLGKFLFNLGNILVLIVVFMEIYSFSVNHFFCM